MAKNQGGGSKRPRGDKAKARGLRCYATAQQRHAANGKAQDKREAANRTADGFTPWQQAEHARSVRREILRSAWNVSPWRPGDAISREKSVHEWIAAHKQPSAQPA